MDIHYVPGIEARNAAEAHQQDILIQHDYKCKCMTYWIDEPRGVVFCLIEGPDKQVVEEMHKNSHGLIPSKIIEVDNELVESFLGRITDPDDAEISDKGLRIINDSAFRVLMVSDMIDPVLLKLRLGEEKTTELLGLLSNVVRENLLIHGGREVEYHGNGFIASFTSASKAASCALDIQKKISHDDRTIAGFYIGLSAGEPIAESNRLFGDTIRLGRQLCTIAKNKIAVASNVKDLLERDYHQLGQDNFISLTTPDEELLQLLFDKLEKNWQDPDFTVPEFCRSVSMSNSGLYRTTTAFWGLSPKLLLSEYRLEKARELLKKKSLNISQTTFDAGFSSPSYFTKCFKKKFGIIPAMYLDALQ